MRSAPPSNDWNDSELDDSLMLDVHEDFALDSAELVDMGRSSSGGERRHGGQSAVMSPAVAAVAQSEASFADQPAPRITIHASCDRSETARMISTAARDRRLAKATVTVEMGGIDAALVRLSSQRSPDLLILDAAAPPALLLRQLDRLAEHVDSGTKVIIIGAANDISLYRELMNRGVSEYLISPIDPVDLCRTIGSLYADPDKPFAGRLVSVVGAKGGCGASTIAHNLAWTVAERCGANTTLVDLDVSFGTAALDFNQDPAQTVADALSAPDRLDAVLLDRLLVRQTERLLMFSAPGAIDRDFDFEADAYEKLIDIVRRTAPFVVLDLPHMWTPWVRDALVTSDEIVLVATPDLAGLRNAKNIVDRLTRLRNNDAPPQIVLNMTGVAKRPEIPPKDYAEALGCPLAAVIPFEPAVFGQASNNGQMIAEVGAGTRSAEAMNTLAQILCGRPAQVSKPASILDKLPFLKR